MQPECQFSGLVFFRKSVDEAPFSLEVENIRATPTVSHRPPWVTPGHQPPGRQLPRRLATFTSRLPRQDEAVPTPQGNSHFCRTWSPQQPPSQHTTPPGSRALHRPSPTARLNRLPLSLGPRRLPGIWASLTSDAHSDPGSAGREPMTSDPWVSSHTPTAGDPGQARGRGKVHEPLCEEPHGCWGHPRPRTPPPQGATGSAWQPFQRARARWTALRHRGHPQHFRHDFFPHFPKESLWTTGA